jgi:hypothetical protein
MDRARPLRDVFSDLVGTDTADAAEPAEVLRTSGHPDLPDTLVAEAVGSYADTAPIEVAEHLSPYVMAHSPVPLVDAPEAEPGGWLEAVATAPVPDLTADPLGGLDDLAGLAGPTDAGPPAPAAADPAHDIAFGHGGAPDPGPVAEHLADGGDPMGTYEHDQVVPDHAAEPGPDVVPADLADLHDATDSDGDDDGTDGDGTDPSWLDG